jgi:hypothetical protein
MRTRRNGGGVIRIAHRGASAQAPENTHAAFAAALDLGVDAIELDCQLSADGELVVIHDETLDRTTSGLGPVGAKTWAELATSMPARGNIRAAASASRGSPTCRRRSTAALLNVEIKSAGDVGAIEAKSALGRGAPAGRPGAALVVPRARAAQSPDCGAPGGAWRPRPAAGARGRAASELGARCTRARAACRRRAGTPRRTRTTRGLGVTVSDVAEMWASRRGRVDAVQRLSRPFRRACLSIAGAGLAPPAPNLASDDGERTH